jgi:hypothetical protein
LAGTLYRAAAPHWLSDLSDFIALIARIILSSRESNSRSIGGGIGGGRKNGWGLSISAQLTEARSLRMDDFTYWPCDIPIGAVVRCITLLPMVSPHRMLQGA